MRTSNYKEKTVSGIFLSFISQGGVQFLRFFTYLILARFFLTPEDFGVFNLSFVVIGFSKVLSDFGFGKALIQIKNVKEEDYSTAFWINLLIGITLTMGIFFFSHWISIYFKMPEVSNILKVLSITFFLNSATIIHITRLQKNLNFKFLTINEIISYLLGAIVALIVGFLGFRFWALVAFHLTIALASNIWLWFYLSKWKPKFILSKNSLKKIFGLSLYLIANDTITYLSSNIDKPLIGRSFGKYSLGLYSQAYALSLLPVANISNVIVKVLFPSFANLNNDKKTISRIFTKISNVVLIINGFILLFVSMFSKPIILLVLGEKWIEMTQSLQIFSIIGLLISLRTIQSTIYLSLNKNKQLFNINLFVRSITIIGIIIASNFSFNAVLYTVLASFLISYLITTYKSLGLLEASMKIFYKGQLKILLSLLISVISIKLFYSYFQNIYITFLLYSLLVFFILQYTNNSTFIELKKIIYDRIKKR